jgi:hypothetical protein
MDLKAYYRKVREAEAELTGEHIVVVSLETPEGGKSGVMTEVPRLIAARLIAEHRARGANEEETFVFRESHREAREQYQLEATANRMQVVVIPTREADKKERS